MAKTFSVQDQFSDTVSRYVSREMGKGKDPRRSMIRIMTDWVFKAMAHAPPADTDDIVLYYMGLTRLSGKTRRKRAAIVHEMQDTLALAIVRSGKYKQYQGRGLPNLEASKMAKKYVGARRYSAGLLRSGFFPALRALKASTKGEKGPKYKKSPPGALIPFKETANELTLGAINFATYIAEQYPDAFEQGMPAVIDRFTTYLHEDMIKEQQAAGLAATKS